jgi:hypothetical protein
VRAFDLMEGAANIHLLSVFQGLLKGSYPDEPVRRMSPFAVSGHATRP